MNTALPLRAKGNAMNKITFLSPSSFSKTHPSAEIHHHLRGGNASPTRRYAIPSAEVRHSLCGETHFSLYRFLSMFAPSHSKKTAKAQQILVSH